MCVSSCAAGINYSRRKNKRERERQHEREREHGYNRCTSTREFSIACIDRFRKFLLLARNTNTSQLDRGENRLELQPNGSDPVSVAKYLLFVQFLFN